jgi:hypothetical protein
MIHQLVIADPPILAAAGRRVCSGRERVGNPLDGAAPIRAAVDADDIETRRPGGASGAACDIHLGGFYQLLLLAPVDGGGGTRERAGRPEANLDEDEAVPVEHHEIDFTVAASIIAFEWLQAPFLEVAANELLGSAA